MKDPKYQNRILTFVLPRCPGGRNYIAGICLGLLAIPGLQSTAQILTGERLNLTGGSPVVSFQSTAGQHFEIVGLSNQLIIEDESGLPTGADNVVTIFAGARENSLVLDAGGLIGFGTDQPLAMLDLRPLFGSGYVRLDPDSTGPSIDVLEDVNPAQLFLQTTATNRSSLVTLMAPNVEFAMLANSNGGSAKFLIRDMVNGKNAMTIFPSPLNNNTLTIRDGNVGFQLANPSHPFHMRSGAHCTTGGVWTNACSRALKDNIKDLDGEQARKAFAALNPVTYHYKNAPNEKHVGFIAEDVPDIVATPDRKGLATLDVVAVLTKVMQQQDEVILEQQQEIARIRQAQQQQSADIDQLVEELSQMRAQLQSNQPD